MSINYDKVKDILEGVESLPVEPEENTNKRIVEDNSEKLLDNLEYGEDDTIKIDFGGSFDKIDDLEKDNEEVLVIEGLDSDNDDILTLEEKEALETGIIDFGQEKEDTITKKKVGGIVFDEEETEVDFEIIEDEVSDKALEKDLLITSAIETKNKGNVEGLMQELENQAKDEVPKLGKLLNNVKELMKKGEELFEEEEDDNSTEIPEEIELEQEQTLEEELLEEEVLELEEEEVLELEEEVLELEEEEEEVLEDKHKIKTKENEKESKLKTVKGKVLTVSDDTNEKLESITNELNETVEEMEEILNEYSMEGEKVRVNINKLTSQLLQEKRKMKNERDPNIKPILELDEEMFKDTKKVLDIEIVKPEPNMLEIFNLLKETRDDLEENLKLGKIGVKVKEEILNNLVKTGKHYIEYEETTSEYLTDNIGIIKTPENEGKCIYYYKDIPSEYTGYRVPLLDFINELKQGIVEEVVQGDIFSINLIDDKGMERLTGKELEEVLKFLDDSDIKYEERNFNLHIAYDF